MRMLARLARTTSFSFFLGSLVACSHAEPEPEPEPAPSESAAEPGGIVRDDSPADVPAESRGVLVGSDGRGLEAIPPEVLADVRAQLVAAGAREQVADLERQYDFATGRAKDPARARALRVAVPAGGAR